MLDFPFSEYIYVVYPKLRLKLKDNSINNKLKIFKKLITSKTIIAPKVREILSRYRDARQLKSIALKEGVNAARLTEMITRDGQGNYKRTITPYYLGKFIEAGFMSVDEILDGRKLSEISDRARIFFERMILSRKTIGLVVKAQQRCIDVDKLLETILYQKDDNEEYSR